MSCRKGFACLPGSPSLAPSFCSVSSDGHPPFVEALPSFYKGYAKLSLATMKHFELRNDGNNREKLSGTFWEIYHWKLIKSWLDAVWCGSSILNYFRKDSSQCSRFAALTCINLVCTRRGEQRHQILYQAECILCIKVILSTIVILSSYCLFYNKLNTWDAVGKCGDQTGCWGVQGN